MEAHPFPSDPATRRAIAVLDEHDIERCHYDAAAAQFLYDKEAYVLQYPIVAPADSEVSTALQNILDSGLARQGVMLVQSPYDSETYANVETAPTVFALEKKLHFSTLCYHLGATEVIVEECSLQTRSGKHTLDVRANNLTSLVKGNASVDNEELEKFGELMCLRDEFEGGAPDIAAAERHLRRNGLWSDTNMRTLIDMRREGSNKMKSRKLVINLSSEAKSNLTIAARLKVPGYVNLSAEYKRVIEEKREYTVTFSVRFEQSVLPVEVSS